MKKTISSKSVKMDILDEINNEMIREAINYFNKPHFKIGEPRYIYRKTELEQILANINPDTVKVETEKDDIGNFFCYILSAIPKKATRNRVSI